MSAVVLTCKRACVGLEIGWQSGHRCGQCFCHVLALQGTSEIQRRAPVALQNALRRKYRVPVLFKAQQKFWKVWHTPVFAIDTVSSYPCYAVETSQDLRSQASISQTSCLDVE
eukprot:1803269-Amphidinium_carterae.1